MSAVLCFVINGSGIFRNWVTCAQRAFGDGSFQWGPESRWESNSSRRAVRENFQKLKANVEHANWRGTSRQRRRTKPPKAARSRGWGGDGVFPFPTGVVSVEGQYSSPANWKFYLWKSYILVHLNAAVNVHHFTSLPTLSVCSSWNPPAVQHMAWQWWAWEEMMPRQWLTWPDEMMRAVSFSSFNALNIT